ncbi:hypothetical protein PCH_Pc12g09350 [Penicillium rubens Wisconsin 54-1255]|uniref:Uncharacterized protein n=1 Tax=Penicillium rubens (strain ATCC 28089 / DSM 1075 / NRRL 1951 / Wisconsin 54-1255) TaxID=500485 RepID=B6GZ95_PENRW|nr:hypothetical protein PCH_Pc12g09350 [Penicillium rubens Wisconsin 54-1255]
MQSRSSVRWHRRCNNSRRPRKAPAPTMLLRNSDPFRCAQCCRSHMIQRKAFGIGLTLTMFPRPSLSTDVDSVSPTTQALRFTMKSSTPESLYASLSSPYT